MATKNNEKKEMKLTPTKSSFKLIGKAKWLDKENAYKDETITKGDSAGKQYHSLRFGVQTSPTNIIPVEIFGMEQDKVFGWHGKTKTTEKFDWEDRNDLPDGFILMDTTLSLERDGKNKLIKEHYTNFDAAEKLYNELENEDSIFVSGEIQFQSYENQNGETVTTTKYIIKLVSRMANPVDFEDEKFKEESSFEMEVICNGSDVDKETKNVYLSVYTIQYGDKWQSGTLVVNGETHPKLGNSVHKFLKPMDFVKVSGLCINASETVEAEEPEEDDWGGTKPKGYDNQMVRNVTRELRITYVDQASIEKKKYKPEDFVTVTVDSDKNPFKKKNNDNDNKNKPGEDFSFGEDTPKEEDEIPF